MSRPRVDPRWPKVLSLSVHELRTPMTVVSGYIRMLLKDRAGPLSDQQRRLLEETERSCGRLSALLAEISDLSNLEAGTATFNHQSVDLRGILREAVDALPPLTDRTIRIDLHVGDGPAPIVGDATRLRTALGSILLALRRELVTSDRLIVREQLATTDGGTAYDVAIGDEDTLRALDAAGAPLPAFDEWRGGSGLSLPVARRILESHGGAIWSAPDGRKAGARMTIPAATAV